MSRKLRNFLLAALTISVVSFVFLQFQVRDVEYGGKQGIAPKASNFKLEAAIYYLGENSLLVSEIKNIDVEHNELVSAVFKALKTAPKNPAYHSLIAENCQIISEDIFNEKLYLNLSEDILDSKFWQEGKNQEMIYALVNSITQFDSIDSVQLRIAGRDVGYYLDDGINYADLHFNPQMNEEFTQTPENYLLEFLDLVKLKYYSQAYDMTLMSDDGMLNIFVKTMKDYNEEIGDVDVYQISSESDGDQTTLVVLYRTYDKKRNHYYDVATKIWHIVKVTNGEYRILWYPQNTKSNVLEN